MTGWRVIEGDAREQLRLLDAASVHACVTSPPYFGLRDYGHDEQIGLEQTPEEYVDALVAVFAEVRRVLRPDGTLWLNLGDSYAEHGNGIALVFARVCTPWFQSAVERSDLVCFPAGRVEFVSGAPTRKRSRACAPSVLIAFGDECAHALARSGLGVCLTASAALGGPLDMLEGAA